MGKGTELVRKAYAVRTMLDHSQWAKVINSGEIKKPRRCIKCQEVLTVGYDPSEVDVAGHQYEKLLEAGMDWIIDPAS